MNTRRLGQAALVFFPLGPPAGDIGAVLFAGVETFFKTDAFALEEAPRCAVARRCAAFIQFGHHCAQGQIRLLGDPRQQPLSFAGQQRLFPAAHRLGRSTAARPPALPSPGTCGRPQPNQSHDPAGPANRVLPCHAGPNPASIFNHKTPKLGI